MSGILDGQFFTKDADTNKSYLYLFSSLHVQIKNTNLKNKKMKKIYFFIV